MTTLSVRGPIRKIARPFGEGVFPRHNVPTDADRAWKQGFDLGRDGVNALAPFEWPDVLKDAFYDGYGWGEMQADADKEAAYQDELAMLATLNSPEGRVW